MANIISPFGVKDFMHQGGTARTEELQTCWIKSSDVQPVFNGDLVSTVKSSAASGGVGNYVTQSSTATAGYFRGVFRGCEYYSAVAQRWIYSAYYPGSGVTGLSSGPDVKAWVVTDPNQYFLIQGSTANVLGSSNIMAGYQLATTAAASNFSSAAGNTATGLSGMMLGSSTAVAYSSAALGGAIPFVIIDFYSNWAPGNPLVGFPSVGTSIAFVNGTDNTTVGQWIVVKPLDWEANAI